MKIGDKLRIENILFEIKSETENKIKCRVSIEGYYATDEIPIYLNLEVDRKMWGKSNLMLSYVQSLMEAATSSITRAITQNIK